MDWFKKSTGQTYAATEDPGVLSVQRIYNYYKKFGYNTIVMGASFRNIGEIQELTGCDYLTISPVLLDTLASGSETLTPRLEVSKAVAMDIEQLHFDEKKFRWDLNQDAMATEKLSEGIRNFAIDNTKLENVIKQKLAAQ
jgi:transaldolase